MKTHTAHTICTTYTTTDITTDSQRNSLMQLIYPKYSEQTTQINMYWIIITCITLMTALLCMQHAHSKTLIDRVAIIVNDKSILESDIQTRLIALKQHITKRGAEAPPHHILLPQLIERMVLESIQDQMATRFQIQISDQDINDALAQVAQQHNKSLNEYITELEATGQSTTSVRHQIARELKHYKLQQRMLSSRIQVTEKEVEEFLQSKEALDNQNIEYKLRHILLQISERADPKEVTKTQEQAKALIQAIRKKENSFEQTAIAVSDDGFALNGGDMGWRRLSQVPTRFTKIVLTLKPGEVSDPLRSPSGFHILYLEDKKGEPSVMVERAKIEHILIKPNQVRSDDQAQQLATDLRQHILEGKTLAELARTFSDDPGSALNGGNLGWVSLDSLDETFAATAREMQLNTVSPVFRSQFGYHLLRVIDRKQEDMSQVLQQSRAQRRLQQRKFEDYLPIWFSEIRSEAYVEFKPPYDTYNK